MLLLIDGTNVVMRYAAAMVPKELSEIGRIPDEMAVKVLESVTRSMFECAKIAEATHMIVALDSTVGSWRRAKYPEYKANRSTSTAEWTNRLAMHLHALNVYTVRVPEFEADDIIATLAARAGRASKAVSILSSDSDLLQLAALNVTCYQYGGQNEARFVPRSMAWIRAKYDIDSVGHLPAFKALVGEPGDHLPGVPGIGKVKAKKLLEQNTIEALKSSPQIDGPQFTLMLELTTLRIDVPIDPVSPGACRIDTRRGCGC
jgi:DNA polymerase-1